MKILEKNIKNKIHFVGIGGIGMSGIAEVLFSQGYNEYNFIDYFTTCGKNIIDSQLSTPGANSVSANSREVFCMRVCSSVS